MEDLYGDWVNLRKKDVDVASLTTDRYDCAWRKYYAESDIIKKPIKDIKASEIKAFYKSHTAGRAITRKELNNLKVIMNALFALAADRDG